MSFLRRCRIRPGAAWRRFLSGCTIALIASSAQAGPVVDAHYGQGGIARLGATAGAEDSVTVAVRLADGGLVVAGTSEGRHSAFMQVLRFTAAGQLAPDFGDGGVLLLPPAVPTQIVRQGERLLIAGYDGNNTNDFFITRIGADGRVDATFGAGGTFRPGGAPNGWNRFMVLQPDGSLLLGAIDAEFAPEIGFYRLVVRFSRLGPDGALDSGFGERTLIPGDFDPSSLQPGGIAADGNGGFVAPVRAIERLPGGGFSFGTTALLRVTPDGTLDAGFGTAGVVRGSALALPPGGVLTTVVRGAAGGWLVVHYATPVALLRLDDEGRRDAGFGIAGQVLFPVELGAPMVTVPLSDGGALLGFAGTVAHLVRLRGTGVLDPGYGQAGAATIPAAGYVAFFLAAGFVDSSGAALFAGTLTDRFSCTGNSCRAVGLDVGILAVDASGTAVSGFGRGDGVAVWNRPAPADVDLAGLLVLPTGAVSAFGQWALPLGGFEFGLERFDRNGVADTGYGRRGQVSLSPVAACTAGPLQATGKSDGSAALLVRSGASSACGSAEAQGFTVDPTGRIVAIFPFAPSAALGATDALASRPDGRVVHALTRNAIAEPTQVAPGGIQIEQVLPEGFPDPQFGNNGQVVLEWPATDVSQNVSLALLPDGALIAGSVTTRGLVLHKLDAAGRPVTGFGQGGRVFIPGDYPAAATEAGRLVGIAVLADTSLYVQFRRGTRAWALRLTPAGDVRSSVELPALTSAATFVTLADDSVVMAGVDLTPPTLRPVLRRLLKNDTFDPAFGPGGMFVVPGLDSITALALASDGRLLVGGTDASGSVVMRLDLASVVAPAIVVEFHNGVLDHYFVTASPAEAAAIDAGAAGPGWARTGLAFRSGGAHRVCRFYGNAAVNPATRARYGPNAHFYTATADECAFLEAIFDPARASWRLESYDFLTTPATIPQGAAAEPAPCPDGTLPVYRAYNRGFARGEDSNHRFTTSVVDYEATVARGWAAEGARMCAPQQNAALP
jgi:uncharacterized delta-60 repeat protein